MLNMPVQSLSSMSVSCIGCRSSVSESALTIIWVGTTLTKKMVCQP
jgi:hypothetical protein